MKTKKRIAIALFLIIFIILILFIFFLFFGGGTECRTDADCVKVTFTCCPCSMGGEEKCVSAKNASAYLPKDCEQLFCLALYNCKIEKCVCKKGICVEIKK